MRTSDDLLDIVSYELGHSWQALKVDNSVCRLAISIQQFLVSYTQWRSATTAGLIAIRRRHGARVVAKRSKDNSVDRRHFSRCDHLPVDTRDSTLDIEVALEAVERCGSPAAEQYALEMQ